MIDSVQYKSHVEAHEDTTTTDIRRAAASMLLGFMSQFDAHQSSEDSLQIYDAVILHNREGLLRLGLRSGQSVARRDHLVLITYLESSSSRRHFREPLRITVPGNTFCNRPRGATTKPAPP
jgi:hypothetical protein